LTDPNSTDRWLAQLADGSEQRGWFRDDNSFDLRQDIRWTALYARQGIGIVYLYPRAYEGLAEGRNTAYRNTFWNRSYDNKLYFRPVIPRGVGKAFAFEVSIRAFPTPEHRWERTVRDVVSDMQEQVPSSARSPR